MDVVVQILILFIVIGFLIKISFNHWWFSAAVGGATAAFIAVAYPWAAMQSKTGIADYLLNKEVMQNTAVLITLEASVIFGFTLTLLNKLTGKKVKSWMMYALEWFPGLLIFPVLFFILTKLIFAFPGVDFKSIAYLFAGGVLLFVPLCASLVRYLIPEEELRLEVLFIITIFVVVLGLVTTVNSNVTYAAVEQPLNWRTIAFSASVFVLLFALGILINRLKWRFSKRS